mmetsp:Transcript_25807/g.50494  ORF Transcript_25807/g.50494 Transcript_25807/m.50494 type:complete len:80 (+) Transcript_25807:558-797(+)
MLTEDQFHNSAELHSEIQESVDTTRLVVTGKHTTPADWQHDLCSTTPFHSHNNTMQTARKISAAAAAAELFGVIDAEYE